MLHFYVLLFGACIAGVGVLIGEVVRRRASASTRRALLKMPRVAIAAAEAGQVVRVTGRVACPEAPLVAPLTQRPCVYYDVIVEDFYRSGTEGRPTDILEETQHIDFLLSDEEGTALISGPVAPAVITQEVEFYRTFDDDHAPPELEAFLGRHGRKIAARGTLRHIEAEEKIIGVGDVVTVVGKIRREPDPRPTTAGLGYRDVPRRTVIEAPPGGRLLVSEEPRGSLP